MTSKLDSYVNVFLAIVEELLIDHSPVKEYAGIVIPGVIININDQGLQSTPVVFRVCRLRSSSSLQRNLMSFLQEPRAKLSKMGEDLSISLVLRFIESWYILCMYHTCIFR